MVGLRIIAGLIFITPPLWAQAGDVAVVVNEKNPVTRMTVSDLRKVFDGEKRMWPGGIPVKLIIRAPQAHERQVVLHLLELSEQEFGRYWIAQAYKGEAGPVAVFSNGMQKEAVMSIPGAIALIEVSDLKPGLKVLKIDDKLPGQDGYPLH
jgi:ABC-type phosphate transport system substrate-binding protein